MRCQTFELKYIKGRSDFNLFPLFLRLAQSNIASGGFSLSLFLTFKDLNKQHKRDTTVQVLIKAP